MSTVLPFSGGIVEPFVTADDVARTFGMSRRWVEYQVRDHGMPSHRFGSRRRFRLSEVERWRKEREAA